MRAKHLALSALFVLSAAPALAGPHDVVVYAPGYGGTAADAKPYIDTFLGWLEKKLAWKDKGTGDYVDDPKALAAVIEKKQPGFGLVSPAFYLESLCSKTPVTVIATVVRKDAASATRYHVVVKKGTAQSLDDLKGKKLISNHLQDRRYVSRLVLDGRLDVEKQLTPVPTNSPLKPFKAVDRGEADAALVDDDQWQHAKSQPFAQNLEVIYTSPAMPPPPVVAFDKVVKPADRDALKKALIAMCGSKDGAETCKSMTITRFEDVDPKAYAAAAQKYCK